MTVYVSKVRGLATRDGLIAGALAGAVETVLMMLYSLFGGTSFWELPTLLAGTVGMYDSPPGFSIATVVGIGLNILILTLLGGLYTIVAKRQEGKGIIWSAIIFALVAWAIGYFIVLSPSLLYIAHGFYEEIGMLTSASSMLIYGTVLGGYLVRRQSRELVDSY